MSPFHLLVAFSISLNLRIGLYDYCHLLLTIRESVKNLFKKLILMFHCLGKQNFDANSENN